jgi:hypothetical protein
MKAFFLKYKFQIGITLLAIIWILILNFLLQLQHQTVIFPDSTGYLSSANNIYFYLRGDPYRPILMGLISGIPYLFGGNDDSIFQFSLFVNSAAWLASSLLLFDILKDFVQKKWAFFFVLLYLSCISNILITYHLLAESLFTFFLVLFIYFLKKYYDSNKFIYLAIALSVLIFSMLVKPASKFIAILVVLYFIKTLVQNYKKRVMILVYLALLAVVIQVAGLKYQFGDFTISYIDGVTYHDYICSKAKCLEQGKEYHQMGNPRADYLFTLPIKDQKALAEKDLIDQLKNNKTNLIKAYFMNLIGNSSHGCYIILECINKANTSYFTKAGRTLYVLSALQNRIFTVFGFLLALIFIFKNRKANVFYAFVGFVIVYIIGISGISSDQGDRFHIVVYPFILILVAKYLQEKNWIKPPFEPLQK